MTTIPGSRSCPGIGAESLSGQHAGRTDVALTGAGEAAASALTPRLAHRRLVAVFSSPLSRAMRTAELAGLTGAKPDPDLLEWDYGGYEGLTAGQIREARPGWDLWRDGASGRSLLPGHRGRAPRHLRLERPVGEGRRGAEPSSQVGAGCSRRLCLEQGGLRDRRDCPGRVPARYQVTGAESHGGCLGASGRVPYGLSGHTAVDAELEPTPPLPAPPCGHAMLTEGGRRQVR
ncbi:histidine phosphatase family protein [Streptomyces sp. NBC_00090]|uniref:histidine phosphatase family protein n=1 Tax=Streptomyces sp. NBC_00090 TaxID=2903619 RepID=UPI003866C67C